MVQLGSAPAVTTGQSLVFNSGVFEDTIDNSDYAIVLLPETPLVPSATVSVSDYSLCSDVVVSLQNPANNGARELSSLAWSATDSSLNSFLQSQSASSVTISRMLLAKNTNYVVSVAFSNFVGT